MDSTSVYVILNEWEDEHGDGSIEIVGAKYFSSEDDAWFHLSDIADSYDVLLENDATSIELPDKTEGMYETYYIMELSLHVNP